MNDIQIDHSLTSEALGRAISAARSRRCLVSGSRVDIRSEAYAEAVQTAAADAVGDFQRGYTTLQLASVPAIGGRLVWGPLFDGDLLEGGSTFELPRGMIGAQIALLFTVGRSYPDHEEITRCSAESAIVASELALVLLGRRLPASVPLTPKSAIADFALHVAHVRGLALPDWRSAATSTSMIDFSIDDHVLGGASWQALFDRSFDGFIGLASGLYARGLQLNAGDLTAVGARLPAFQILPGQTLRVADFNADSVVICCR